MAPVSNLQMCKRVVPHAVSYAAFIILVTVFGFPCVRIPQVPAVCRKEIFSNPAAAVLPRAALCFMATEQHNISHVAYPSAGTRRVLVRPYMERV